MFLTRSSSKIDACRTGLLVIVLLTMSTTSAYADPTTPLSGSAGSTLRLRGDALAETKSPVGLLVLHGEDKLRPWLDVETVTWMGANAEGQSLAATGDVLTLSVRARDVASGSEVRAGRMVVSMGAIRPVQIDGARVLGRAFGGTTVEAFGGVPVVRLDQGYSRPFDWTAGGRVGQDVGVGAFGASYDVRRRNGTNDQEEVGADLTLTPTTWLTAAGRAAFDLVTRGPTDILGSVSAQNKELRGELFTTHRSPGRLLPSTSLFSVLGDFPSTTSGATFRWRAFPRLEMLATGSVQVRDSDVGGQGLARTSLALDDGWQDAVGIEVRHVDFAGARWNGVRTTLSLPLGHGLHGATELELVQVRDSADALHLYPWALGALGWRPGGAWELGAGVEGSASPTYRSAIRGLARATYAFDAPPPKRGPQ